MIPIILGTDQGTGLPVTLNPDLLRTHLHLIGATGSGKTNLIKLLIKSLALNPRPKNAIFLVDIAGNLSYDILRWIANDRLCPEHVRRRLVYIEPAREQFTLPFNPLLHTSEDHLYYQCGRAVEIVLRAWASQNIEEMPRLRHWSFAAFFSAARMGYPIAVCRYLLRPGTDEHRALLDRLPADLRGVWAEVLQARGNEAVRLLESTRNRLAPFFDSGILRRMFSAVESRLDVPRFIRERKIVLVNVAGYRRLDHHIGQTIGSFAVNEIIQTAIGLSPREVDPTYLILDEFQHYVNMDLYDALPTLRQSGLRLVLAHQSFQQLERGDIDLTGLIWQARSRLMFANDGEDADLIADELAKLSFDPLRLKDVLSTRRQRVTGHRREWLNSASASTGATRGTATQRGGSGGSSSGETRSNLHQGISMQTGSTTGSSWSDTASESENSGSSRGQSETLVPNYEEVTEIAHKTFSSFEEQRLAWMRAMRSRRTGEAYMKLPGDGRLYNLQIADATVPDSPAIERKVEQLLARNFESEWFVKKEDMQDQEERLRQLILNAPTMSLNLSPESERALAPSESKPADSPHAPPQPKLSADDLFG